MDIEMGLEMSNIPKMGGFDFDDETAPEEIIERIIDRIIFSSVGNSTNKSQSEAKQEALDRINKLVEEVIGPDDRDYSQDNTDEQSKIMLIATSTACNEMRAEQRQRLAKLFKGDNNGTIH